MTNENDEREKLYFADSVYGLVKSIGDVIAFIFKNRQENREYPNASIFTKYNNKPVIIKGDKMYEFLGKREGSKPPNWKK